jgi:hypothetical protein
VKNKLHHYERLGVVTRNAAGIEATRTAPSDRYPG